MKRVVEFAVLALLVSAMSIGSAPSCSAADDESDVRPATPRMGMNLAGPVDWNTELPFVDVFRLSRQWISQRAGAGWGKGPKLDLDEHGWVRRLESDGWADTPMCMIEGGHFPSGAYTVLYEGTGTLEFRGSARVRSQKPGRMIIDVDATKGALWLRLSDTDPNDYVRNIRVIMPGYEDRYVQSPFLPNFVERWRGAECIRFMDWMHTNGSTIQKWSDRPTPQSATFTKRGVPVEIMVDLCNEIDADAWFCMPHRADDDFVRRFAEVVRDRLEPGRRVYIEYSNELWNGLFKQHHYAREQGEQRGLGPDARPKDRAVMYAARRSLEIFAIWEEVFRGRERLVRVLGAQAAGAWSAEHILLPFEDAGEHADALAIAPYLGLDLSPRTTPSSGEVSMWTADQVCNHLTQVTLPIVAERMMQHGRLAREHNLDLIAYEGGQHLVGLGEGEKNELLNAVLDNANRDERMAAVYVKYFEAWTEAGGGVFMYFTSMHAWTTRSRWGLLPAQDVDPRGYPGYRAVIQTAREWGQDMNMCEGSTAWDPPAP